MLRQDINLYRALEKPAVATTLLTWKRFWLATIGFTGLLFLIFFSSLINVYFLKSERYFAERDNAALEKKFISTKNQYPALFFSEDVEKSVAQLQNDLNAQEKLLESISKHVNFSIYLIMLSNLITPQTWLTEILFDQNGDTINLKGMSLNGASIQRFLNNLLAEKLLSDYTLNIKNISQDANQTNRNLHFEITAVKKE